MRTSDSELGAKWAAGSVAERRLLCAGHSYLERLGLVYMDQIRLTIVTELYMREMGIRQFCETFGGGSYTAVRRHFVKLVEAGWLRKVRTVQIGGRGRPEDLYRSTELAVIDTATWRMIPVSIRDAFTIQLVEEMAGRLGEALEAGIADALAESVSTFKRVEVDELAWCKTQGAVERCFQTLLQEQTDAKIRLDRCGDQPLLMIVNLAAFEAAGPAPEGAIQLPPAGEVPSPPPWQERIGKVFADRLDLEIVDELNRDDMTPAQLHSTLGGATRRTFLRRCKRLADDGWVVSVDTETGGALHGASVYRFRAAAPNVSESDIYEKVPLAARSGPSWAAFKPFIATSIAAVETGRFNNRPDRHMTMTPLIVDETGCSQVTKALRTLEGILLGIEAEQEKRSRRKGFCGFPAAILIANFQSPLREMRE